MHNALFIDEILRHIFALASESDRPSLVAAACCCKAWSDPALDFLWDRLTSFAPLLHLLPQISVVNGEYVYNFRLPTRAHTNIVKCSLKVLAGNLCKQGLDKYNAYARRVKHVKVQRELRICSGLDTISKSFKCMKDVALPRLTTAHIAVPRCSDILIPLYYSPNLVQLDIDLGFKAISSSTNDIMCELLERVAQCCHELRHVSLRGIASTRLNDAVANLRNIDFLSLRLGNNLLPHAFKAVMDFPHLMELEIHAGHLQFHDFNDIHEDYTIFTSLRKLHIRAQATLIEDILHHIPPNTLQHLQIELDDQSACPTFWNTCFTSIANKIGNDLIHLSLEHHFEVIELSPSIPSDTVQISNITTSPPPFSATTYIPFETLRILQNTKQLRHFSCDITLPPPLSDDDLDKMATWWPNLEHFELGSSVHPEEPETLQSCQMTASCLHSFANRLTGLKKLILPLAIGDESVSQMKTTRPSMNNQLQNLTIAQLTTTNPIIIARCLHTLFPALKNLEGPCDDTEVWSETLHALRLAC